MRLSFLGPFALVFAFTLVACGDDGADGGGGQGGEPQGGTAEGGSATGAGGSGGSGGADDGCPTGSHAGEDGCEAELAAWTEGPPLRRGRDHHVTFVAETAAGPFLYAVAGASSSGFPLDSVERAAIAEDGSLGNFEEMGDLPSGLVGPGLAQVGQGVVIAGGLIGTGESTTTAYVGIVDDDGNITFTEGPPLANDRYHVGMIAHGGFVYAIGGLVQGNGPNGPEQSISDVVERASFDGTTLGTWETLDPLPQPTTHHTVFSHGDGIYVLGGGSGLDARTDILRATVDGSGNLGAWEPAGELDEGRATASATIFLDQLYLFAGMTTLSGGEQSTVLRAPIDADGAVGTFESLVELPLAKAHCHQTPLYEGHFYSVAGSIDHVGQKQTFIGALE